MNRTIPINLFRSILVAVAAICVVAAPVAQASPGKTGKKAKAVRLVVQGADSATAGRVTQVTVSAVSKKGRPVKSYRGPVTLTSSDDSAALPGKYAFRRADRGRHVFEGIELRRAGTSRITATGTRKRRVSGSLDVAVEPAALAKLTLSSPPSARAGGPFTLSASGADAFGNPLGDLSSRTRFSIAPDGACEGGVCSATKAGPHEVSATSSGITATAHLDVLSGPPARQAIVAPAEVTAGESFAPVVREADEHGNPAGADISGVTFDAGNGGTCADGVCSYTLATTHTLTANVAGETITTTIEVVPGPVARLELFEPDTIPAGQAFEMSARTRDVYDNPIADVTSQTTFAMSNGTCTGATCSSTKAGAQFVSAIYGDMKESVSAWVLAGPLAELVVGTEAVSLTPAAPAGAVNADFGYRDRQRTAAMFATGRDRWGNAVSTGPVTYKIAGRSCSGSVCAGGLPGWETVVATAGGVTGSRQIKVESIDDTYVMTCRGSHYDMDGAVGNGCEVDSPNPGHGTQEAAIDLGSKSCSDSASQTRATSVILSDLRRHTNPGIEGDNNASEPVWYRVRATGGVCVNDLKMAFSTSGGIDDGRVCYGLTIKTDRNEVNLALDGSGTNNLQWGSGSYSDNSDVYFRVWKMCPGVDRADVTLDFHL